MNVSYEAPGDRDEFWLDFENAVLEWEKFNVGDDLDEGENSNNPEPHVEKDDNESNENALLSYSTDDVVKAKKKELGDWKKNKVYTEVYDNGQDTVSTGWVCNERNGECKARLVAKGCQDPEGKSVRSDSPTISK